MKKRSFKALGVSALILVSAICAVYYTTISISQPSVLSETSTATASSERTYTFNASSGMNQDGSQTSPLSNRGWFGTGQNTAQSYTGLRFEGVSIGSTDTMQSAVLEFTAYASQWIYQRTNISAEITPNPAIFSANSPISSRARLQASVTYEDNLRWNNNSKYQTPNLVGLLKMLQVNNSSKNINIIMQGTSQGQWGRKFFRFGGATTPKLIIKTTGSANTPSSSAPTTSPVSSIASSPSVLPSQIASPSPSARSNSLQPSPSPIRSSAPTQSPSPSHSGHSPDPSGLTRSHAMGRWTPTKFDTCPTYPDYVQTEQDRINYIISVHDSYSVVGPDGKLYPTWHPPIDPKTGCRFGHEHGRDPALSALYPMIKQHYAYKGDTSSSGIPFGYAAEQLDVWNAANNITDGRRHEDHVGYKIMWENNQQRERSVLAGGSGRQFIDLYCDMLFAIHQGTHSQDAFTNNMHEVKYFMDCNRGSLATQYPTRIAAEIMMVFGRPGGFNEGDTSNGSNFIFVAPPNPPNSLSNRNSVRFIPTINTVLENVIVPQGSWSRYSEGLYEDWIGNVDIVDRSGRRIAYFDPHFAVFNPSRFFWPGNDPNTYGIERTAQDRQNNVGRSVDVCYMSNSGRQARGGECDWMTNYSSGPSVPQSQRISYDSLQSVFNGCKREFYFNNTGIWNAGGPEYWYTDPFGRNGSTTAFPGSVRQYLRPVNNDQLGYPLESIALGANLNWCTTGVHAPN